MTNNINDLAPCPFCGSNNLAGVITLGSRAIVCVDCGATGPRVNIVVDADDNLDNSDRDKVWNARPLEEQAKQSQRERDAVIAEGFKDHHPYCDGESKLIAKAIREG